jgi:putative restriction endonuclease
MTTAIRWTEDQTKRALYLYFQLPFGQLHQKNREIIALAESLGRTPSSIAMKLANFASLDPKITESGRKGLDGATALDKKIWDAFHSDWTKLVMEVSTIDATPEQLAPDQLNESRHSFSYEPLGGMTTTRAEIERRIGQDFFRRAVLANFDGTCSVTGVAEPRLLIASHISAWKDDVLNRHNPRNGLCLSATFDRAFDQLLMTVMPDLTVRFSEQILKSGTPHTRAYFAKYERTKLRHPARLALDEQLLARHNQLFFA